MIQKMENVRNLLMAGVWGMLTDLEQSKNVNIHAQPLKFAHLRMILECALLTCHHGFTTRNLENASNLSMEDVEAMPIGLSQRKCVKRNAVLKIFANWRVILAHVLPTWRCIISIILQMSARNSSGADAWEMQTGSRLFLVASPSAKDVVNGTSVTDKKEDECPICLSSAPEDVSDICAYKHAFKVTYNNTGDSRYPMTITADLRPKEGARRLYLTVGFDLPESCSCPPLTETTNSDRKLLLLVHAAHLSVDRNKPSEGSLEFTERTKIVPFTEELENSIKSGHNRRMCK